VNTAGPKTLGHKSEMTKTDARKALDCILAPFNAWSGIGNWNMRVGNFIRDVYYPFCRRKWKRSTRMTTEQRIDQHIVSGLEDSELRAVQRVELQDIGRGRFVVQYRDSSSVRFTANFPLCCC
jgi:hypothetical protein